MRSLDIFLALVSRRITHKAEKADVTWESSVRVRDLRHSVFIKTLPFHTFRLITLGHLVLIIYFELFFFVIKASALEYI